jgi:hypothetical protein
MDVILGLGQDLFVCFLGAAVFVGVIRIGQLFLSER